MIFNKNTSKNLENFMKAFSETFLEKRNEIWYTARK